MSGLDPLLVRAFEDARAERPRSAEGKARTLAALGLRTATAQAATSRTVSRSGRAASHLLGGRWWTVGLALLATGGGSLGIPEVPTRGAPVAQVSLVPEAPATDDAAALASATPEVAPAVSIDDLPDVAAPPKRRRAPVPAAPCTTCDEAPARATAGEGTPGSAAEPTASLRDEIEAIEQASRALSSLRCAVAEQHLADYRARFPTGRLQREAEVVAIEIAGRSGDTARARVAARRFVERFPDSPYALRLAPWLSDDGVVARCTDVAR